MINVAIKVSKSTIREQTEGIVVVQNSVPCSVEGTPNSILEIPEDYYLELDIRYNYDDGTEIYKMTPKVVVDNENYYGKPLGCADGYKHWGVDWLDHNQIPHKGRPFYGLAGIHEIKIIVFDDTEEREEISFMVEVLASRERAREINKMLKAIDDNYDEITNMCINSDPTKSSLFDLISEAKDIVDWLTKNWNILISQLRRTLEPMLTIKPNGLPNSPEALYWLCSNPDALGYCRPNEQNFKINNIPVRTDFAAEEVVKPQYNLFENNVIAAFFEHIQSKLADIRNFIAVHKHETVINDNTQYPNYVRYSQIVEKYNVDLLSEQEDEISRLQDSMYRFYNRFKQITGIRHVRRLMPKITPFVARTSIYHNLYTIINDWYAMCKQNITLNDFAMHFIKIDKLYEFTVLTRIVNAINALGGYNSAMEWHDMSEGTFGGVKKERPITEPYNYYKWFLSNRDVVLELWYEPAIRTIQKSEEGDLIVVRGQNYHSNYALTPDFVFRITWYNKISDYLIMDAKYSSDNTIQNMSLPKLTEKYLYSLSVKKKGVVDNPVRAVWAIYSRGNKKQISGYSRNHSLASEYMVFPSLEGIQVSTDDKSCAIKDNISILIKQLKELRKGDLAEVTTHI